MSTTPEGGTPHPNGHTIYLLKANSIENWFNRDKDIGQIIHLTRWEIGLLCWYCSHQDFFPYGYHFESIEDGAPLMQIENQIRRKTGYVLHAVHDGQFILLTKAEHERCHATRATKG